jgi:hypothetical protein
VSNFILTIHFDHKINGSELHLPFSSHLIKCPCKSENRQAKNLLRCKLFQPFLSFHYIAVCFNQTKLGCPILVPMHHILHRVFSLERFINFSFTLSLNLLDLSRNLPLSHLLLHNVYVAIFPFIEFHNVLIYALRRLCLLYVVLL